MINSLKEIYSLDEIGYLFRPIMKDVTTFDDDIIDMGVVYAEFSALYEKFISENLINLPIIATAAKKRLAENSVAEADSAEALSFLTLLTLMIQTISIKKMVNIMMETDNM
jgi:hypothetical protein